MPVWHASIALLDLRRMRPVPTSAWALKRITRARRRAAELLAGVGCGADHWQMGEAAAHLRRRLSAAELGRIDPAWLARPAIDGG